MLTIKKKMFHARQSMTYLAHSFVRYAANTAEIEVESENKITTFKARKVLIFQLFLAYPTSIQIHFSWHSKHGLIAVVN
jgi:hypothetical protein